MNLFQILALMVVVCLLVLSLVALLRGLATRREMFLSTLVWLAAGVAIVRPGVTKIVANALGIGRGADLVLYCAVVVTMVGFVMIYARLRRIRRELTLLVRHLAIRDVMINPSPSTPEKRPESHDPSGAAPSA